jgi:ribosomal protein S18 acetylase RimI-like enzyme
MWEEVEVRPAGPDELPAAGETLARAFERDPAWAHLLPAEAGRGERILAFFRHELAHLPPGREVWVADDGSGAAVWARPGRWRVPTGTALRAAPAMWRVFGRRLPLAARAQWRAEGRHPDEEAHWYLHFLGVVPERQGRGLGERLMAPVLERCDRESIPAYLEASTERNRALYERSGFAVSGRFAMPAGGPELRQMWREPLPTSAPTDVERSAPGFA